MCIVISVYCLFRSRLSIAMVCYDFRVQITKIKERAMPSKSGTRLMKNWLQWWKYQITYLKCIHYFIEGYDKNTTLQFYTWRSTAICERLVFNAALSLHHYSIKKIIIIIILVLELILVSIYIYFVVLDSSKQSFSDRYRKDTLECILRHTIQVQSCALLNWIYFRFRCGTGKLKSHRFLTTFCYI